MAKSTIAMASKIAAAVARHAAASGTRRRFAPRFTRRALLDYTTASTPAPPPLAPSGPRIVRRGLAMIPGDRSPGTDDFSTEDMDPYAPDDPETCFAFDEKDLESDETMWAMYERWCRFYNVKRDHDDMLRRFVHFKERARRVHEFNKLGKSYTWGLQIFGDITPEEYSKLTRRQLL